MPRCCMLPFSMGFDGHLASLLFQSVWMWVERVRAYIDIALGLSLAKGNHLSSSLNLKKRAGWGAVDHVANKVASPGRIPEDAVSRTCTAA